MKYNNFEQDLLFYMYQQKKCLEIQAEDLRVLRSLLEGVGRELLGRKYDRVIARDICKSRLQSLENDLKDFETTGYTYFKNLYK